VSGNRTDVPRERVTHVAAPDCVAPRHAYTAYVIIADILRGQAAAILDEWEAEVRRSNSASQTLSSDDLRDDVPKFLQRLSDALADPASDLDGAVDHETTGTHALHRLDHGVELRHLIHEFRLLRQVVLRRVLACATNEELRADLARFDDVVDHAMVESASCYADTRAESRELIVAILGHDLRNPLTAISMNATSLLKAGTLNEVQGRAVSRIARSADRINRIISDLIDLARARRGVDMPFRRESFDIGEVVYYAVDELLLSHPDRNMTFRAEGNLRGSWDRTRIGQMVSNLVGNAIAHGRDPIAVSLLGYERGVEICVTNHGPPIPKDVAATLFEPYRRGSHEGGLGLGLFIVSQIVRGHGGDISVASTETETTFMVHLPRERACADGAEPSVRITDWSH
jgi:signal transduction histidine kinase